MSIKNHKDYVEETGRLKDTVTYIENIIKITEYREDQFNEEIKDAYIHLDFLDSSLSYSSIMLNTQLLDSLKRNYVQLLHAQKKPYFARMDVVHPDREETENLYIGKVSLDDPDMAYPLVVDWRAPIANIYYNGRLGQTSFVADNREKTVDLLFKRQYTIKDGNLLDYMDVDISVADGFLQSSLSSNATEKLKDIVATIQSEQNEIIRADIEKPLIIQGAAGSGKTTIALHRIAYLIYTYSETFYPENFMILAPNNLFLDYISQVLPELGVDKVNQTTYPDLMTDLLGKKLNLSDSNYKLSVLTETVGKSSSHAHHLIAKAASFKNDMGIKKVIDVYADAIMTKVLPDIDFCLDETLVYSKDFMSNMFLNELSYLPVYKRIEKISQFLKKGVKVESKKILNNIASYYNDMMFRLRNRETDPEVLREMILEIIDERDKKIDAIKKASTASIKHYLKQINKKEPLQLYKDLITDSKALQVYDGNEHSTETYEYIANESEKIFSSKKIEIEDLAPLVYLKEKFYGLDNDLDIKYAVVDEAQDFGNFQLYMLKRILKTNRFTILGDLSQGIHMYRSLKNWDYLRDNIFDGDANYLTLEQSYRTTIEIMNAANDVICQSSLKDSILARPVVRHGDKPHYKSFASEKDLIAQTEKQIDRLFKKGYSSIALICKSQKEAVNIHQMLSQSKNHSPVLLDEKGTQSNSSIVVLPSHLAKGLEFDAVVIMALDDTFGYDDLDIKLLYVAMTRALHDLSIYYMQKAIPLIEEKDLSA